MTGMRDKLIHEYFGIDYKIVWKNVEEDLSKIIPQIKKIRDPFE